MKKYFNYYATTYYHEEYKKTDTKYFFTKEEAEKWLEKKIIQEKLKNGKQDLTIMQQYQNS